MDVALVTNGDMEGPGRPTVMTPEVLQKLDDAFMAEASDEAACFIAGISPGTLYKYQRENPEYINRKERLKDDVRLRARMSVARAIRTEERPDTAKWYLERKDRAFKAKSDVTTNDKDLPTPILGAYVQDDRSDQEGDGDEEKDTGGAGGNLGVQDGVDPDPADPPGADGPEADPDERGL